MLFKDEFKSATANTGKVDSSNPVLINKTNENAAFTVLITKAIDNVAFKVIKNCFLLHYLQIIVHF